jgi:2-dehydropantoate 2-reductase
METSMYETLRLAHAVGIALPEGFVAAQMQFLDSLPESMQSSMQNDLAAGNRLEAPWLCGAVARMYAARGSSAPINRTLFAALKPYVDGRTA